MFDDETLPGRDGQGRSLGDIFPRGLMHDLLRP